MPNFNSIARLTYLIVIKLQLSLLIMYARTRHHGLRQFFLTKVY
jgi:hypothetical protein